MVKASNLIKKLLPIGLVIGGLLLLSQSKRKQPEKSQSGSFPIFFEKPLKEREFIPIAFQETKESITQRLGPLFQQVETKTPNPAIQEYIERAGGFRSGNYQKDYVKALGKYPAYITTREFIPFNAEDDE